MALEVIPAVDLASNSQVITYTDQNFNRLFEDSPFVEKIKDKPELMFAVGVRPNFVKLSPLVAVARDMEIPFSIVNTGQHYDSNMSRVFFDELELPDPDLTLNLSIRTPESLQKAESVLANEINKRVPDYVVVVGDVDSTVFCAETAKRAGSKIVHVESGLRCGDLTLPEERNRIIVDNISDIMFVSEPAGLNNLKQEGKNEGIYLVGNLMIDSLIRNLPLISQKQFVSSKPYALVTLHRQSNVDEPKMLSKIITTLNSLQDDLDLIMPVHPRTMAKIQQFGINMGRIKTMEPQGYLNFQRMLIGSKMTITDSGGIEDETTFLGVPCLTLRTSTERPLTVDTGTNVLIGEDMGLIGVYVSQILKGNFKVSQPNKLHDGKVAERIIKTLIDIKNVHIN